MVSSILSGCVTMYEAQRAETIQAAKNALERADICCTSYSTLPYTKMLAPSSSKHLITVQTPAFVFPAGKSRFIAFELPKDVRLAIDVTTTMDGGLLVLQSYVFYPSAVVLSEDYQPIGTIDRFANRYRPNLLDIIGWHGQIKIDTGVTGARYLVL